MLQILQLLPALFTVIWSVDSDFRTHESLTSSLQPQVRVTGPCTAIQVMTAGVVCESRYDFTARLDFPQIDLKAVLDGDEYLPHTEALFTANQKTIGSKTYRNIALSLQWQPVTPEFLQIYLHEYIPHWGNRVPYRLLWSVRYEECSHQDCAEWLPINETGEILPSDIEGLPPDLAADSNFNGAPAAFWNVNVIP